MIMSTRNKDFPSLLPWVLPAMLLVGAVTVLLSGRVLSQNFQDLARGATVIHPIAEWLQRLVSVFLMAVGLERLVSWFAGGRKGGSPLLAGAFVVFWLGTVGSPALFGAHPNLQHDYFYSLLLGTTAALAQPDDLRRVMESVRTALLAFLLASAVMVAVNPALVLDSSYTQGLLPGVPRYGGLAPHPVGMGIFSEIFLLCLWAFPFRRRWLNALAWGIGLASLFFAQSKTSWVAFVLCALAMFAVRSLPDVWRRMNDPKQRDYGILVCTAGILAIAGVTAVLLFANIGEKLIGFSGSDQGAQLLTLTGRDRIWEIALDEWRMNPVFGYGPNIWDDAYRASIQMPNATSAHNQFYDTLARSGSIGATALVAYALVMLVLALLTARATRGLSVAFFIAIALRSVTEVPLMIFGYSMELFVHLMLIVTVGAAMRPQAERVVRPARARASVGLPA
jgi:O-antigen ligase